jgi:hypothetical protein
MKDLKILPFITSDIWVFKINATSAIRKKTVLTNQAIEIGGSNFCNRED